jgi:hypothetical protein
MFTGSPSMASVETENTEYRPTSIDKKWNLSQDLKRRADDVHSPTHPSNPTSRMKFRYAELESVYLNHGYR